MIQIYYIKDCSKRYFNDDTLKVHPRQQMGTPYQNYSQAEAAITKTLKTLKSSLKSAERSLKHQRNEQTKKEIVRTSKNVFFQNVRDKIDPFFEEPRTRDNWVQSVYHSIEGFNPDPQRMDYTDWEAEVNRLKANLKKIENLVIKRENGLLTTLKSQIRKIKWVSALTHKTNYTSMQSGCYRCGVFMPGVEYLQYRDCTDSQLCPFCITELAKYAKEVIDSHPDLEEEYYAERLIKNL